VTDNPSGWTTFWEKGGWWRAVLVAVVYLALYLAAGQAVGALFGDQVDTDDLFATPQSVFFGLFVPLAVGAIVLIAFVSSLHWSPALFARQPLRGSWWMWIAPVLVVAAIVLRLLGIDYASYAGGVVLVTFAAGLLVGFVEEILTRGIAVKMLRDSGKSEWVVMVASSAIFALMHSTNLLSGQEVVTVGATVVFAFGFGICMYLTLRATGNLISPMLIPGLYAPTLFLATGGIDEAPTGTQSVFLTLAGPANILFILLAVVALIAVRGRVERPSSRPAGAVA